MKIGLLIYDLRSGGAERVLCKWSELLSEKHDIKLYTFDGTSEPAYQFCGELKVLDIPSQKKNKFIQFITIIKRALVLQRNIKEDEIDLLISFCSTANFPVTFQSCLRFASIRLYSEYYSYRTYYRFLIKHTKTKLIVQTERLKKDILYDVGGQYNDKISVISNPLDVSYIQEMMKEQPSNDFLQRISNKKIICFTASYKSSKNHCNLIKSFKLLNDKMNDTLLLLIGGEGELEESIHRMVKGSTIENNVLFIGKTNNPFMYEKKADVFVLPSFYEGIPNVLLEALAVGLPVISTDCPSGPREILIDRPDLSECANGIEYGDYGILVKPFPQIVDFDFNNLTVENKILAEAMETVLLNKDINAKYRANAKKRAAKYDMSEYGLLLENLVEVAVKEGND